ncbi:hypothetical protein BDV93DRAFT_548325 [Ceratobasidium sp. AG-I]|nr:hypothetical protein BDV93DRAFT_548325 [Ceratobasidium sp. AG-I]
MFGMFGSDRAPVPAQPNKPTGKNIVVFCDGTGQDGLISTLTKEEAALELTSQKNARGSKYATNVLKLSRCILPFTEPETETEPKRFQLVFYQSGVGVGDDFQGDTDAGDVTEMMRGNATGSKIRDAYNFIAQNYIEGDKIYLFGFSRGAYTARKIASLIGRLGLLNRREMGNFFHYWSALDRKDPKFHYEPKQVPAIEFVGTWDTVGAVFELGGRFSFFGLRRFRKLDALTLRDTELPTVVKTARHALSYHEPRELFLPTPYSSYEEGRNVQQVWFPGSHSDVGGGYKEDLLADITLCWMAGEAVKAGLALDEDYLKGCFVGNKKLTLHFEPSGPKVNRMETLVKTDSTKEVAVSNLEPNFLYHPSLWAEVTEHPNGRIHKVYSGKPGEPLKKKLTSFEKRYWEEFGWQELLPQPVVLRPGPRGGPMVPEAPPLPDMSRPPVAIGVEPVVFESFSDYVQGMEDTTD